MQLRQSVTQPDQIVVLEVREESHHPSTRAVEMTLALPGATVGESHADNAAVLGVIEPLDLAVLDERIH
jgi:hypothetical protein